MGLLGRIQGLQTLYHFQLMESLKSLSVVIIGAGGTGSYFAQDLLRYLSLSVKAKDRVKVLLIDGDYVEDKNLVRQNFVQTDVGKNKAEVTAIRYSAHFGMPMMYYPHYIEDNNHLLQIIQTNLFYKNYTYSSRGDLKLICSCVDNNKTRAMIHDVYRRVDRCAWIDAGNELDYGQVVLGYNVSTECIHPTKFIKVVPAEFRLPSAIEAHPEFLQQLDKLPTELSCAERAVSSPQTIFANRAASLYMLNFVHALVQRQTLDHCEVFFDTKCNLAIPRRLSKEILRKNQELCDDMVAKFNYEELVKKPEKEVATE